MLAIGDAIRRLLDLAGDPLGAALPARQAFVVNDEVVAMLQRRNGFHAFEGALHVRHLGSSPLGLIGLEEWNSSNGWREHYGNMANNLFFFAEDIFGSQFALSEKGQVLSFDPETGEADKLASGLEGWAKLLLADYSALTGQPLAHKWQAQNGPLAMGSRLLPKIPFVLGGEFDSSNLYPVDAVRGMRMRGALALQIRDLPEGQMVEYKVVP